MYRAACSALWTKSLMHEDKSTSPPPCWSTWFVNIPQVMNNSMQVTKNYICCLFTFRSHLFEKIIFFSKGKKKFSRVESNRPSSGCEASVLPLFQGGLLLLELNYKHINSFINIKTTGTRKHKHLAGLWWLEIMHNITVHVVHDAQAPVLDFDKVMIFLEKNY